MTTLRKLYRPAVFWEALRARLSSAAMAAVLQGAARVHLSDDDGYAAAPAYGESDAWARVLIVPRDVDRPATGATLTVSWLVVVEANDVDESSYSIDVKLEVAHAEVMTLLRGWQPSTEDLRTLAGWAPADPVAVRVASPVWLQRAPQDRSLWDEDRGLRYTSAEYRCELAPA